MQTDHRSKSLVAVTGKPNEAQVRAFGPAEKVLLSPTQRAALFSEPDFIPQRLGCGAFACVYTTPDPDKVVKFTRDRLDAAAALLVQNTYSAGHPNLVRVHEVRRLISNQTADRGRPQQPIYALVVERVDRIRGREVGYQRCAHDRADADIPIQDMGKRGSYIPAFVREDAKGRVRRSCSRTPASFIDRYIDDLYGGYDALREAGVSWTDSNTGNIGKSRQGRFVVLDFGYSDLRNIPEAATLAGVKQRRRKS